jgi:hypothetical protein
VNATAFTQMKLKELDPDQILTGIEAVAAIRTKSASDRRAFRKGLKHAKKHGTPGFSRFANQFDKKNGTIYFDIAMALAKPVKGVSFAVHRFIFPDTIEGHWESSKPRIITSLTPREVNDLLEIFEKEGGQSC